MARTFIRNTNSTIGDHDRGLEQHALDVADRGLDEGRLPELDVGRRHAGRQRLLDFAQRRFDPAGQRDGVGARLLLDADDDGGLALIAGVAALDAGRELDGRDLLEQDRLVVAVDDDRVGEVFEPLRQADIADQIFAAALVDEAAAGVGAEARDRLLDLLVA